MFRKQAEATLTQITWQFGKACLPVDPGAHRVEDGSADRSGIPSSGGISWYLLCAALRRTRTSAAQKVGSNFIPVQGLRAIAVLAVVLYHFWPGRLSGGYVGVDIFFVISGFLITAHLARELNATGRVNLGQFWARRARRLLPASLLVLLFCAIVAAIPVLSPLSQLPAELQEIVASTFYVENWFLALNSADYLAHSGDPTMVQHYWSLSLEEQFYVLWPLIMLLAAWIAVKYFRGSRLRPRSRSASSRWRRSRSACGSRPRIPHRRTSSPSGACGSSAWRGDRARAASAREQRDRQLHPGLGRHHRIARRHLPLRRSDPVPGLHGRDPDLAAAAIIAASNTERWWYPTRILAIRPMRFTGDISYSLYLWHWPLIIIAPSVPFWGLTIYHRVALVGICFLLAWLTKKFVEDPTRTWKPLTSRKPRLSLWAALAAMVIVAGTAGAGWPRTRAPTSRACRRSPSSGPTRPPASARRCPRRVLRRKEDRPDPARARLRRRGSPRAVAVLRAAQRCARSRASSDRRIRTPSRWH
jgi:peptidoglycan/LPS O-acetylase OafA/YrhL